MSRFATYFRHFRIFSYELTKFFTNEILYDMYALFVFFRNS